MGAYVVGLDEDDITLVGGKAAGLAALRRIEGVRVPPGFCLTTAAFRRGGASVPADVAAAVHEALAGFPPGTAWAVRSSATTEDGSTASAAGQHESVLDVVGPEAVLAAIARVWASLGTAHAVAYRGGARAAMAVVVQEMVVRPRAAGVLFTADPVGGNRRVAVVEAVPGLADALVSGRADPEVLRVRDGAVIERRAGREPALTDAEAVALVALGRRVEAALGAPQDLEWCLDARGMALVQARPITTLFPIPEATDAEPHVYLSVGHQQMMTDPMRPLGLSLFRHLAMAPMQEAGGRLWVDVAARIATPAGLAQLVALIGRSEPLTADALRTLLGPGDEPEEPAVQPALLDADPALVDELKERGLASIGELRRRLDGLEGPALLDAVLTGAEAHKQAIFGARDMQVITTVMDATWWLADHLEEWLGEVGAADVLSRSAPGNPSAEMGLALLDVADVLRPHPEVVAFLEQVQDEHFLAQLPALPGGREVAGALVAYLDAYGMRCVGEIDITRPRWSERPSTLLPLLLGNVRGFAPGEGRRRFDAGAQAARAWESELLARLRELPDGARKAEETRAMVMRLRTFAGFREHPKYVIVARFAVYKQALMGEADRLAAAGVLELPEDVFWLTLPELAAVVRERAVDRELLDRRRRDFAAFEALTPPRVLTSEGEALSGAYRREDVPADALAGLAVSAGTVEGRARVVRDLERADLQPGDILVTTFTDPSWSPLFVAAAGLVTEVGGVMTHGAVVAREYGLPAVVGVPGATTLIADGRRIRVHGTAGYVELL